MTTNIDDVAQTLAEYERLAITSGATVQIDPPEFSSGANDWAPFWIGDEPPKVARATVHRDGIPTTVYVVWDESVPIDTSQTDDGRLWRDLWLAQPTKRFGSFALRTALRRAFREVVGDKVEPDEDAPKIDDRVYVPVDRTSWDEQIANAQTIEEIDRVWEDMRADRARTGAREVAYKTRRTALAAAEWEPAAPELSSDELARHRAFFGGKGERQMQYNDREWSREVQVAPRRAGKAPQDHLPPSNRAARRAASRKGRR